MSDRAKGKTRSEMMALVRQKDTAPEVRVRQLLHRNGYRFRVHVRGLPGTPDIVLPRHRVVIQVNGCFWHGHEGCARGKHPATNRAFWEEKLRRNKERDAQNAEALTDLGWRVLTIWECELADEDTLELSLREFIG